MVGVLTGRRFSRQGYPGRRADRSLHAEAGTAVSSCEMRRTANACLEQVISLCAMDQGGFRHSAPEGSAEEFPFENKTRCSGGGARLYLPMLRGRFGT